VGKGVGVDLGSAVGVEDAVGVVDFVLEDAGGVVSDGFGDALEGFWVSVGDHYAFGPRDIAVVAGDGEAALTAFDDAAEGGVDLSVGVGDEGFAFLIETADDYDALANSDLRACDAYAVLGRVGYGGYHVLAQGLELLAFQLFIRKIPARGAEDGLFAGVCHQIYMQNLFTAAATEQDCSGNKRNTDSLDSHNRHKITKIR